MRRWPTISIFGPAGKTMRWMEKWFGPFRIVTTFSISMQSLGEIELRAPAVGAKIGVFLYVTLGLPARGWQSSNKYCVTVYRSILMRFSSLFQNGLFFQVHYIVLNFVDRCRHNFSKIAVKNCEKSKNWGKSFCTQLRIESWDLKKIPRQYSLGGKRRCAPI